MLAKAFLSELVPRDPIATLLRECGALSERTRFRAQLALELARGAIREISEDGQAWLEAVG